jgi:4-diphosphocytidyl-2-C-methyl-D-erythritol kinase
LLFENPPLYGVIVKPGVGVPTGPAYAALDALPGREPGRATARVLDALRRGASPDALGAAMGNDFEAAILPAYPEVAAAHRVVSEAGAVRALLCGSGAAVFGLARDRDHARALTAALCGRFPYVHLAEGRP